MAAGQKNIGVNYRIDANQAIHSLQTINTNLVNINRRLYQMAHTSASTHGAHKSQINSLALRFVGYNMVLNGVMNAQQKLVEFVKESIKAYREFETRIAEVNTILAGETNDQLNRLATGVEHLSVKFGKSTSDMAKGLYDILSAAFDAKDAINLLNTATKASIAGLSEVRTSVNIFTSVLNSYGKTVEQATHVSDVLFQSVIRGKFQFEDLESALGYVVPIAAQAGIAFNELMAALSTTTRHGLHLDMTTRGLALAIQNIISPSEQASQAAKKYGIEMNSLALRVLGLQGWFKELNTATKEYGRSILSDIVPNMRSLRVAMVLAGDEGVEGFAEDLDKLSEAAGRTEEALAKIQDTSAFTSSVLEQQMEKVKREVGAAWDETALGIQGGVVNITKAVSEGIRFLASSTSDGIKVLKSWQSEARQKGFLAGIVVSDNDIDNAKTYLHLLKGAQEASKYLGALQKEGLQDSSAYEETKRNLESITEASTMYEESWNRIVGNIQDGIDELDELRTTLSEVENEIETLQEELYKPMTYGWGEYKKTIEGTLGYQLELLKANQRYEDLQHDIKMGLADETYQYKSLNSEMQEAVRIIREHQKAQEEDKETTYKLNIAMKELQLATAKIQLAGMMRRRGTTRNEEKRLKMIQIEMLKLRIQNMEADSEETVEMYDNYMEKKKLIDDYLVKIGEERYQLKYTYDQEIVDLDQHIKDQKDKLDTRYKWWDITNTNIITSTDEMITSLEALMEEETFTQQLKDWGIDLNSILNSIQTIQSTAKTATPPGKTTSTGTSSAANTLSFMKNNLEKTPEIIRNQILATMPSSVRDLIGYQRGTYYVPETAPYMLHRGETVNPSGRDTGEPNVTIQVNVTGNNITNPADEDRLAARIATATQQTFMNSRTGKSKYRLR